MGIELVKAFFLLCTVINAVLLFISFLITAFASDWVYRTHSKLYPMSREAFNVAMYGFIGFYKILLIVFNLVPYIVICILR